MLEERLPCIADGRKIRVRYRLEGNICVLLPYLASDKPNSSFDEDAGVLSYKYGQRVISIDRYGRVGITQLTDLEEAESVIKEIAAWINDVERRKDKIDPLGYKKRKRVTVVDILRLMPRTNCGKCRYPTCLAFVVDLLEDKVRLESCEVLKDRKYIDARKSVAKLLLDAGLDGESK